MEEPRPTDSDTPLAEAPPIDAAPTAPMLVAKPSFKRRHWGKLTLLTVVGIPAIVFAIWTAATLGWSYSSGERPGIVQKISKKGWVCKTWEGTLNTNIAGAFSADSFSFTVQDDSLAHVIEGLNGKKVALHYEQHKGVPSSCFGETEYFITGVRALDQ